MNRPQWGDRPTLMARPPLWKRLAWFALIYGASIAALGVVARAIRAAIG